MSPEFQDWVSGHISDLVRTGVLLQWDKKRMGSEFPVVIAPLLIEPSKP